MREILSASSNSKNDLHGVADVWIFSTEIIYEGVRIMKYEMKQVLPLITGDVICHFEKMEKRYGNGRQVLQEFSDADVTIESIQAQEDSIVLYLTNDFVIPNDLKADWVKEHIEQYGEEPGFF